MIDLWCSFAYLQGSEAWSGQMTSNSVVVINMLNVVSQMNKEGSREAQLSLETVHCTLLKFAPQSLCMLLVI